MDRLAWKRNMSRESAWPWPCPACARGRLQIEKNTLQIRETSSSRDYRNSKEDGHWEPDMTTRRFTCLLVCKEPSCREPVIVCGTTGEEPEPDPEGGETWKEHLYPKFFHPAPPMIQIPEATPETVRKEVEKAFALYWCDLLSCANAVRNAIEQLLTHYKIRRNKIDAQRKTRRVSLHERIQIYSQRGQTEHELATAMFAVKWIGNEGSHPGKLTKDDLLDAFQLLEHVLRTLFVPPDQNTALELAKAIHKRKKPRSHVVSRKRKSKPVMPVPPPRPKS